MTATKTRSRTARCQPTDAERQERAAAYTALMDQLDAFAADVDSGEISDKTQARIDKFAQHYSERNALLIVMQCPKAKDVAGFVAWKARGRQVRKGEHGIKILAPAGQAQGEEAQPATDTTPATDGKPGRKFFRMATVFDISQTDEIK